MSRFPELAPAQPFSGPSEVVWWDFFLRQADFLREVAKLDENQAFVASQKFVANGGISSSGGIMLSSNYKAFIDVQVASSNVQNASSGGGNAAIYVQHLIDSTAANSSNVNSGIRVQIESTQTRASSAYVNDLVGGYFGIRNRGVDVGAFGIHVDAYSNGTGTATSMYGMSAEMYRESSAGFTAAFHARTIDAVGYFDNDYGFLASPSVAGTKYFTYVFSGGSLHTGLLFCDYGLDLAYATCDAAAIRIDEDKKFIWDGLAENIHTIYNPAGELEHYVSGTKNFGLENTGRIFIVSNGNTDYGAAGAASGRFLAINVGGTVYKLDLLNF